MNIPQNLKYSKSHEWIKIEGDSATIGITDYAQSQLGDVVFIELPPAGKGLKANEPFGSIESVKSVSDLISPVTAEVLGFNEAVKKAPEIVNTDPYNKGWMIKVKLTAAAEVDGLMTAEQYRQHVTEES